MLLGLHLILALLSPRFVYGSPMTERPILPFVGVQALAGALYVAAVLGARRAPRSRALLVWVLLVGALLRAVTLPSRPVLEDDWYRYLWDGAVVAEGVNPYAHAPADVLRADPQGQGDLARLRRLADESGLVAARVNHPRVRTIYPPVAQAAFALSHLLAPWSLIGWRLVVLAFDVGALLLLVAILLRLRRSPIWLVVYWWNPIVVKELFNSSHMDVIAVAFALGALLLALEGRRTWAAAVLGLAVGAKVWPVLLLPLLLRPLAAEPKRLVAPALAFFGVVGALLVPVVAGGLDASSGFVAYGRGWEMNDAFFMALQTAARPVLGLVGAGPGGVRLAARLVAAALLGAWMLWVARRPVEGPADLCRRCVLVVAAAFLLSPTQYPWYFVWVVPLLALGPRLSLLLLSVTLPMYYLRFHLWAVGGTALFDYGVVWAEFAPIWALLLWEWRRGRAGRRVWLSEVPA